MNTKKYVIGAGLVASMLIAGASMVVAEKTAPTITAQVMPVPAKMPPQIVNIGSEGRTLLRGTVSAVGTDSLTVKSWGGEWVVKVSADTKIRRDNSSSGSLGTYAVGDFVGVNGIASQSAAWTIDAMLVRNWTDRKEITTEVKEKKLEVREEKKNENAQDVQQKINAILEQIKKIQAQIGTQQAQ